LIGTKIDDLGITLNCYKFEFSENFARFRRFGGNNGEKNEDTIRYDRREFNVDSKVKCDQLNLAHATKTKNTSAQLVQYRFKIREGRPEEIRKLWRKGFVKEDRPM